MAVMVELREVTLLARSWMEAWRESILAGEGLSWGEVIMFAGREKKK
jgi:hypothetical protein